MVCLGKHRATFLEPKHSWTLGNEGRRAIERLDFFNRYCGLCHRVWISSSGNGEHIKIFKSGTDMVLWAH